MCKSVCAFESPRDLPASVCPGSTDWIPDLKISAQYAPEFIPYAMMATIRLFVRPIGRNITK